MNLIMFEKEKHYAEICEWWKARNWPPVREDGLSSFGMLAEKDGIHLCAGWLYVTNSSFFWVEWLVTNPRAPLKIRTIGLECLLERLVKEGQGFGGRIAFSSVKALGLVRLLKRHNFVESDFNMTNMVKLCP
jgi:hypothetical protein